MSQPPHINRQVDGKRQNKPFLLLDHAEDTFTVRGNREVPPLDIIKTEIGHAKPSAKYVFHKEQYRFIRSLGSGTSATVAQALWLPRDIEVAVKMIKKEKLTAHETDLLNELQILSKVDHPNLVKMYDWGISDNTVFISMELAKGGELFDRLAEASFLSEQDVATVIKSILNGVSYLHDHGIVHRDLKPENIFMRDVDHRDFANIVVGDFGISRMADNSRLLTTKTGTFGYIAPEVLLSQPYSFPCDLWSIGVITYVLLTGMFPFDADGFKQELDSIMNTKLTFAESYWDEISSEAKSFTASLLKISPKNRPVCQKALRHPWLTKPFPPKPSLHTETKAIDCRHTPSIATPTRGFKLLAETAPPKSKSSEKHQSNTASSNLNLLPRLGEKLRLYKFSKEQGSIHSDNPDPRSTFEDLSHLDHLKQSQYQS